MSDRFTKLTDFRQLKDTFSKIMGPQKAMSTEIVVVATVAEGKEMILAVGLLLKRGKRREE